MVKSLTNEIYAYALENAVLHEKAIAGAVMPKLFQHGLKREDIGKVMPEINDIVKKVNSFSKEQRENEFEKYKKYLHEKTVEEKGLKELPNVSKNMVFRLAPEPSKYNHIGHALSFLLNYLYAKKYKGKCLLRFEDTNPEKVSKEYIDAMKEDVINYLDIKVDGVRYVSDDMKMLYDYAEKLIKMNKSYMCFCDRDKMQDLRHKGEECGCRKFDVNKNLDEWKKFVAGKYKEGEAVLRIKGDMKSQNHVMRDSVIFRAVKAKHYKYKDKYKVWPMYDFYNPIEDSIMGVTHILRSNEFDMRVELQDYIKDLLKLKKQTIVQYGRFNVIGASSQGREIREMIESGKYIGWDDPRLVTLRALKRRGIVKEVYYEIVEELGLTKHQVNIDFNMIAAISRKILDKKADRYSFVKDAVKLKIKNQPKIKEVNVKINPNKKEIRKIKVGDIYISKEDYQKNIGKEIRLMHLFNVKLLKGDNAEFTSLENKDISKVNWVSDSVKVKLMMPDAKYIFGLAENSVSKLKVGSIIQFERFGFCKFDNKNNKTGEYEFWFAHE
ncbi:MAG: glutamate--tRNA ligase [Candidatus Pacearchaeota archaeon]|jgi:glutamyl-tRNA synthetase